jgi:hypothetical protein
MPKKTYTQINTITLAASASSVTFNSIPQNFRDLILVWSGTASANTGLGVIFNSDGGSNYFRVLMIGTGSSTVSASQTDNGFGETGTTQSSNTFNIMDYSATDKHKTVFVRVDATSNFVAANAGRWANNSPITSVTLDPASTNTFSAASTFTLYGIEA